MSAFKNKRRKYQLQSKFKFKHYGTLSNDYHFNSIITMEDLQALLNV